MSDSAWDGRTGTAGGTAFAQALMLLAAEQAVEPAKVAEVAGLD